MRGDACIVDYRNIPTDSALLPDVRSSEEMSVSEVQCAGCSQPYAEAAWLRTACGGSRCARLSSEACALDSTLWRWRPCSGFSSWCLSRFTSFPNRSLPRVAERWDGTSYRWRIINRAPWSFSRLQHCWSSPPVLILVFGIFRNRRVEDSGVPVTVVPLLGSFR
jgi:hypothetical protein